MEVKALEIKGFFFLYVAFKTGNIFKIYGKESLRIVFILIAFSNQGDISKFSFWVGNSFLGFCCQQLRKKNVEFF